MKLFISDNSDSLPSVKYIFNGVIDHNKPIALLDISKSNEYDTLLDDIRIKEIEYFQSVDKLYKRNLEGYSAIYITETNPFDLLYYFRQMKNSEKLINYLDNNGIVYAVGASGAIFGENLSDLLDKYPNTHNLENIDGLNYMNHFSLVPHYEDGMIKKEETNGKLLALPKNSTLFIDNGRYHFIGYNGVFFDNGHRIQLYNKNSEDAFNQLKSYKDLMSFMNANIVYGWLDKNNGNHINNLDGLKKNYCVSSVDDTLKSGIGSCIEQGMLIKQFFDMKGIKSKIYCVKTVDDDDYTLIHCFVLFNKEGKWYLFEHSHETLRGTKKFESLDKAFEYVNNNYFVNRDKKITELDLIPSGISYNEFINFVECKDKKILKK